MINITVRSKKNFKLDKKQFYPQIAPATPIGLNDVAEQIEKQSTVSLSDIKGVLDALQEVVLEAMADGYSVRLGDLGSFRPTLKAVKSREKQEDVSATDIAAVRVRFTPSAELTRRLLPRNVQLNLKRPNA